MFDFKCRYNDANMTPIGPVLGRAKVVLQGSSDNLKRQYFEGAQKMVNLWVLAYIAFFKEFRLWCMYSLYALELFLTSCLDISCTFPSERLYEFFVRAVENGGYACVLYKLAETTHLANEDQMGAYADHYRLLIEYAVENISYLVLDDIVGVEEFLVGHFPHFRASDNIIATQVHRATTIIIIIIVFNCFIDA